MGWCHDRNNMLRHAPFAVSALQKTPPKHEAFYPKGTAELDDPYRDNSTHVRLDCSQRHETVTCCDATKSQFWSPSRLRLLFTGG